MKRVFGMFICLVVVSTTIFSQAPVEKRSKETKVQKSLRNVLLNSGKNVEGVKFYGCSIKIKLTSGSHFFANGAVNSVNAIVGQDESSNVLSSGSGNQGNISDSQISSYLFNLKDLDLATSELLPPDPNLTRKSTARFYKNRSTFNLRMINSKELIEKRIGKTSIKQSYISLAMDQKDYSKLSESFKLAIHECSK